MSDTSKLVVEEVRALQGQPDTQPVIDSIPYLNGQPDTRPTLSRAQLEKQHPGYFPGSVNLEIDKWKRRALVAEKRVSELEEELRCAKR